MFIFEAFRNSGEPPEKKPIPNSKGYPAERVPAAEKPRGIMNEHLSDASQRRMRLHYSPGTSPG